MGWFPSLRHRKSRLNFAAESGKQFGEFLLLGMGLKVHEDFNAGGFISHIGQADRSEVGVLEGPAFALCGGDSHT